VSRGDDECIVRRTVKRVEGFQHLVVGLSSRFTGLPVESVDDEIGGALRSLVECLDVDRSTLFSVASGSTLVAIHSWSRPGVPPLDAATAEAARLPWYHEMLTSGQTIAMTRLPDDLPDEAVGEREYVRATHMKSNLSVPILVGGRYECVLAIGAFRGHRSWDESTVEGVHLVGQILANAVHRRRAEAELRLRLEEIRALQERLEAENVYLREEVRGGDEFADIVGRGPALKDALSRLSQVAPTDSTVLLLGETGTGKELLARALHERSPRRERAFIKVNCAALPATLIESELFGHEKGAFTGATAAHAGRFELADGGTLFLDEVAELPVELQAKLLRVLQDGEVQRLGSTRVRKVDVRLVAATNHDLDQAMSAGRFRPDLYYRLSVFPLRVPPLRARREDIPLLAWAFIQRRQGRLGRHVETIPRETMDRLTRYDWPGNVRELENVLERALILSPGPVLRIDESLAPAAPSASPSPPRDAESFDEVARKHIRSVLERASWKINGPGGAAEVLAVHPNTLRSRMKRLGITRPRA
jgi:formate hydrogenlyase transcriptional activator